MQTGHALAVRRAVATDRARLAALLSDMQAHYGSPDPPGGAVADRRAPWPRQGKRFYRLAGGDLRKFAHG